MRGCVCHQQVCGVCVPPNLWLWWRIMRLLYQYIFLMLPMYLAYLYQTEWLRRVDNERWKADLCAQFSTLLAYSLFVCPSVFLLPNSSPINDIFLLTPLKTASDSLTPQPWLPASATWSWLLSSSTSSSQFWVSERASERVSRACACVCVCLCMYIYIYPTWWCNRKIPTGLTKKKKKQQASRFVDLYWHIIFMKIYHTSLSHHYLTVFSNLQMQIPHIHCHNIQQQTTMEYKNRKKIIYTAALVYINQNKSDQLSCNDKTKQDLT